MPHQRFPVFTGGQIYAGASPGQKMWGGHSWRARGARAYNWVWGGAPSGVQGQGPWSWRQEGGAKPPEAENLLAFDAEWKQQICSILRILQTP